MTTATLSIDLDALVASVRKVAAAQPDHVYEKWGFGQCSYLNHKDRTQPGCIVGHAFADMGFTPEQLAQFDETPYTRGLSDDFYAGTGVASVLKHDFGITYDGDDFGITYDEPNITWLSFVQSEQDNGATWAKAVQFADDNYLG